MRISDPSIPTKSFNQSKDFKVLIDSTTEPTACTISVKELGNSYIQGSNDGITWSDSVLDTHIYVRISTDGGTTWNVINKDAISQALSHVLSTSNPHNVLASQITDFVQAIHDIDYTKLMFDTTIDIPTYQEGTIYYNKFKKALSYYNDTPDVEVNLGREILERAYNNTGDIILNGTPLYLNGDYWEIATAKDYFKSRIIGIATHDIPNGEYGYACVIGEITLDLTMFDVQDTLYLGDGVLTNVFPINGDYICRIGVVKDNSENGILYVRPIVSEYTADINSVRGWSSDEDCTIIPNGATRELSVLPTDSEFYFYENGFKYRSEGDVLEWSDVTGTHDFYYDKGELKEGVNLTRNQVRELYTYKTGVARMYWDATASKVIFISDMRHHQNMDGETWAALWDINKCRILEGLIPINLNTAGDGNDPSHARFGHTAGLLRNQDILTTVPEVTSTEGYTIFYRTGTRWTSDETNTYAVKTAGTGRAAFNLNTGDNWSVVEADNNNYVLIHLFVSPTLGNKTGIVIGQSQYSLITDARIGSRQEMKNLILAPFPIEELSPVATIIVQTSTTYSNAVKSRFQPTTDEFGNAVDYIDWRFINPLSLASFT